LTDPIYRTYEGLQGWPPWLREARTRAWQAKVGALYARQKRRGPDYNALWGVLQDFPTDAAGRPTATRPTRLGNILNQSEQDYPVKRYGLSGPFYWPRLWLLLDKDAREEISNQNAIADGLLLLSAGAVVLGALYLTLGLASAVLGPLGATFLLMTPEERLVAGVGGIGLFLAAYLSYQLSLPAHIAYGRLFKSSFDVYRSKLKAIDIASAEEIEHFISLRKRLQFGVKPKERGGLRGWFGRLFARLVRPPTPVPPPPPPILTPPLSPGATRPVRRFVDENSQLLLVTTAFLVAAGVSGPESIRNFVLLAFLPIALVCLRELRMIANADRTGALLLLGVALTAAYALGIIAWFLSAAHASPQVVPIGAAVIVLSYGLEQLHLNQTWAASFRWLYGLWIIAAIAVVWLLGDAIAGWINALYRAM
jgi:hypothetical protein